MIMISELLRDTGLSPHQFAKLTGWHYDTIEKWCKDDPPKALKDDIEAVYLVWKREGLKSIKIFENLKHTIGHRAPKSGHHVGSNFSEKKIVRLLKS
ncbi:MAG: hypothetical protein K9L66_05005 [Spirochaetaceae bacterium]|nr:hypothetical protein [Spirochaetaceae bacterium]MCF7951011.1 hypothetical protein [Spirochaetaceae bacterium]